MKKGIQELFDELIKKYNLRAITIEDITWYGINDLPIREPRKTFSDLRKQNKEFIEDNTRRITNKDVLEVNSIYRNFDKVNNAGETFGNEEILLYLVQISHMSLKEKEKYFNLFNKNFLTTRMEVYFLEQLEEALKPFDIKGIRQYSILNYRIDYYIPSLNIAIEYDENEHKNYSYKQHEGRQLEIEKELGCRFIRVSDKNSYGYNIGFVIKGIFKINN